jgi:hypothetical protein
VSPSVIKVSSISAFILGWCAFGFAGYLFWLISPAASQGTWFTQPWPLDNGIRSLARVVGLFGCVGIICGAVGIGYGRILVKRGLAGSNCSKAKPGTRD